MYPCEFTTINIGNHCYVSHLKYEVSKKNQAYHIKTIQMDVKEQKER